LAKTLKAWLFTAFLIIGASFFSLPAVALAEAGAFFSIGFFFSAVSF